jgi:hypothetical protein
VEEDLEQVFIIQLLQRYRQQNLKRMQKTLVIGIIVTLLCVAAGVVWTLTTDGDFFGPEEFGGISMADTSDRDLFNLQSSASASPVRSAACRAWVREVVMPPSRQRAQRPRPASVLPSRSA